MRDYSKIKESFNGCDKIGDFFQEKMIKLSYGRLWNLEHPDAKIKVEDFSIFNPEHLDFVRRVFNEELLAEEFLLYLRGYAIKFGNIERFPYNLKQILSFILIWVDIQGRISAYSESLAGLFSEKVFETLNESSNIAVIENGESELLRFTALQGLLLQNFSPINDSGHIVYGVIDGSEFGYFRVVNNEGDFSNIDPNGNTLTDEQVHELITNGIQNKIRKLQKCADFLNGTESTLGDSNYELIEDMYEKYNLKEGEDINQMIRCIQSEIALLQGRWREVQRNKLKVVTH